MNQKVEVNLTPQEAFDEALVKPALFQKLHLIDDGGLFLQPLRRSIDARGREVIVNFLVELVPKKEAGSNITYEKSYPDVSHAPAAIIVGSGPA
ncbi:MAG: FAD-binding protein, partial [Cytophagales bacterium]|nr:FAD-binding protein [Cytophagales bacterium]